MTPFSQHYTGWSSVVLFVFFTVATARHPSAFIHIFQLLKIWFTIYKCTCTRTTPFTQWKKVFKDNIKTPYAHDSFIWLLNSMSSSEPALDTLYHLKMIKDGNDWKTAYLTKSWIFFFLPWVRPVLYSYVILDTEMQQSMC